MVSYPHRAVFKAVDLYAFVKQEVYVVHIFTCIPTVEKSAN